MAARLPLVVVLASNICVLLFVHAMLVYCAVWPMFYVTGLPETLKKCALHVHSMALFCCMVLSCLP